MKFENKNYSSFITRDLASDPSGCLFGQAIVIWDGMPILDHFTPFQAILAILDNFERVLLFRKTGNFEILAKSLFIT